MTDQIRLDAAHVDMIVAHALAGRPNEACGLLAGRDGRVERVYALRNADESPYTYRVDGREQLDAFREAESDGLDLVGCFHSHTHTVPYPSETDVRQAFYPDWAYLVVGLGEERPVLRAFRIVDGAVSEISLVVGS